MKSTKAHAVVLSDAFWQRRFGGDRGIVNQSIVLDGESYTVIGVMPPGFSFHTPVSRGLSRQTCGCR